MIVVENKMAVSTMPCSTQHINKKVNKKYYSISKLDTGGGFGLQGELYSCNNVHRREGLSPMHYGPLALELPSLGAKPLLFKRSCGAFRLM